MKSRELETKFSVCAAAANANSERERAAKSSSFCQRLFTVKIGIKHILSYRLDKCVITQQYILI